MSFAIVSDSTSDITPVEARKYGVTIIPLTVILDGKEYKDQVDLTPDAFYDLMSASKNLPTTAQPAPYDIAEVYQALADSGIEHIISIHIAGVLSGTVQAAELASRQADVPVTVIDSYGTATFTGLLVRYAVELREQGVPVDEAITRIRRAIPRIHFGIVPGTLENLLKGGRLSPLEAKAAGLLNVRPVIQFDEKGALRSVAKARGIKGGIKKMVDVLEQADREEGIQRIRFTHTRSEADLEQLKAQLADAGVAYHDFGTVLCGPTVSAHLGLGAIGFASLAVQE